MCVIVFKPAGADIPPLKTLAECWAKNPDGAGIAVSGRTTVQVRKGFMKFKQLEDFYYSEKLAERVRAAMVFHFRIGTHGLKDAGNTHPFPVSNRVNVLRSLSGNYPCAVAHNGIFTNKAKTEKLPKVSDTGQFLADCCVRRGGNVEKFWNDNPDVVGWSKLVILRPENRYTLLGSWSLMDNCGCFFSNMYWPETSTGYGKLAQNCGGYSPLDTYGYGYPDSWDDFANMSDTEWNARMDRMLKDGTLVGSNRRGKKTEQPPLLSEYRVPNGYMHQEDYY